MNRSVRDALNGVHPQSLRVGAKPDPQKLAGLDLRPEIGGVFDYALDRSRLTDKEAASLMGYTDQGVISRWKNGQERIQLDKLRLLGDRFWGEFVCGLAQLCEGVQVRTVIEMRRSA